MNIPDNVLQAITDFGDSEVLTFATMSACVILFFEGERRAALRFFLTMFSAGAIIGVCKIIFLGCGNAYSERLHIYSPSGHAALTTAFCASIAIHLSTRRTKPQQIAIWLTAGLLTFCIAASRVLLGYHSKPEICIGFLVGGVSAWAIHRWIHITDEKTQTKDRKHVFFFIVGIAIVTIMAHGHHFPAERIVRYISWHLQKYIPACQNAGGL